MGAGEGVNKSEILGGPAESGLDEGGLGEGGLGEGGPWGAKQKKNRKKRERTGGVKEKQKG